MSSRRRRRALNSSTDDQLVSAEHGRSLFDHLKKTDKEVEYYEVEGEAHGGGSWWVNDILDIIEKFIRRWLS